MDHSSAPNGDCLNPMRRPTGPSGDFAVPKLSLHGIYIPNGCKQLKVILQLFYGSQANSNEPFKNEKNLWN